jgi:hypothetical protein
MVNPDANIHGTIGMNRSYGMHSGKLTCRDLEVNNDLEIKGGLTFGDASVDNFIIKGRVSTGTAAGAAVDIGAAYTSGELMEYRTTVSDWSGVAGSFKGYYFQAQATAGNASYGLRNMEIIGTANITTGTTGIGSLQTLYVEANLKHGTASWTLGGYGAAIEATSCIYAGAGTLTVTNDFPAVKVKVQGANGVNDYTKFNGVSIYARDGDNAARVFGDALSIEDPADSFASDWTNGIYISAGMTTAINVNVATTTGLLLAGTATDGVSITGACTDAIHISGTNTTTAFHISGDQAIFALFDVDASADNGLEMNIDTTKTLSTGIEMSGAGTLTTGILINPTACTTAINVDTGVVDVATRVICSGAAVGYETPSLSVGTYGAGTALVDTALVDNIFFSVNVRTATNKTSSDVSCMAAYIGNGNTAATANTKMQGLLASMQLAGNVFDAYSVQAHLAINASLATANANGHITGSSAKVTVGSGFTVSKGWVTAGLFIVDGAGAVAGAGTMCHGVAIVAEAGMTSSTCDSLLYLNADSVVGAAITTIGASANIPYLFNMTDMGNSGFITTGGSDCDTSAATDPSFTIKVVVPGGADGWIRVWGAA